MLGRALLVIALLASGIPACALSDLTPERAAVKPR